MAHSGAPELRSCGSTTCFVLFLSCTAVLYADAARILHSRADWADEGDPSGYSSVAAARVITPAGGPTPAIRTAVTPENAEATSNAAFVGVNRLMAPSSRRSYATVEADPIDDNEDQRQVTIRPRQRSVIDLPMPRGIAQGGSGNDNMPALVMGGVAHSQTYEGATAISATDAVAQNKGGKFTPISYNMLTSKPGVWKQGVLKRQVWGTSRGSWGASNNNPVGSLAVSGVANGKIALAQAEDAVAMSQTEKSTTDPISKTAWQN